MFTLDQFNALTYGERIRELEADNRRLRALVEGDKWRLALESLTPGGSEFYNDPDNCLRWITESRSHNQTAIKTWVKRAKKAEALVEIYKPVVEHYAAKRNFKVRDFNESGMASTVIAYVGTAANGYDFAAQAAKAAQEVVDDELAL